MSSSALLKKTDAMLTSAMPIAKKARQLGLAGPEDWQEEAVARGCFHYLQGRVPPPQRVDVLQLSNEELALLLLQSGAADSDPWRIRVGAMMLGADGNNPAEVVRLAPLAGCEGVLRAVAEAAVRYEPDGSFWQTLLQKLPQSPPPAVMPHHSRFVSMPGLIGPRQHGKPLWLRPRKLKTFGYAA